MPEGPFAYHGGSPTRAQRPSDRQRTQRTDSMASTDSQQYSSTATSTASTRPSSPAMSHRHTPPFRSSPPQFTKHFASRAPSMTFERYPVPPSVQDEGAKTTTLMTYHKLVSQAGKDINQALLQRGKTAGRVLAIFGGLGGLGTAVLVTLGLLGGVAGTFGALAAPPVGVPLILFLPLLGIALGVAVRQASRRAFRKNETVQGKIESLKALQAKLESRSYPTESELTPKDKLQIQGELQLKEHTAAVLKRLQTLGAPIGDTARLTGLTALTFFTHIFGALGYAAVELFKQNGGGRGSRAGLNPTTAGPYWGWRPHGRLTSKATREARLRECNRAADEAVHTDVELSDKELQKLKQLVSPLA